MSAEGQERAEANGGRSAGSEPAGSYWTPLLIFLAGCIPLVLVARGLHLVFDLPAEANLATPALLALLATAIVPKLEAFRHGAVVLAVGMAVGALAMLCFLPVTILAQDFDISIRRTVIRLPAAVLLAILGGLLARLIFPRLAVPLRTPANGPSGRNAS